MSNLEDLIRELAKRGELSNISISRNGSNTSWRASFTPCSAFGVSYAEDKDPVKAIMVACDAAKIRKRAEFKDGAGAGRRPKSIDSVAESVEDLM